MIVVGLVANIQMPMLAQMSVLSQIYQRKSKDWHASGKRPLTWITVNSFTIGAEIKGTLTGASLLVPKHPIPTTGGTGIQREWKLALSLEYLTSDPTPRSALSARA